MDRREEVIYHVFAKHVIITGLKSYSSGVLNLSSGVDDQYSLGRDTDSNVGLYVRLSIAKSGIERVFYREQAQQVRQAGNFKLFGLFFDNLPKQSVKCLLPRRLLVLCQA